jgi:putative ABC transport system substrate-binding protein
MLGIRRREFITLIGGVAAWPLPANAQQLERARRIGWLSTGGKQGLSLAPGRLSAFKRGLANLGWVEGRNLAFEERWASNDPAQLRSFAAELAASHPDLIFVTNSPTLAAMRRATGTIPILFADVADPVGQGFVSSLAQPGGNITGFAAQEFTVAAKTLELLKRIAPNLTQVAFLYDPAQPAATGQWAEIEATAPSIGVTLSRVAVRGAGEVERAIGGLAQTPNGGLYLVASPVLTLNHDLIVEMAVRYRLPAIYYFSYFARTGGLASYGPDDLDLARHAASYADRILKGEKPVDLPVQLPTKFEFVLNLKTAKAMGLVIPESVLALADEVIE